MKGGNYCHDLAVEDTSKWAIKFGERIETERKRLKYTVTDLSIKIGISRKYLTEVENGERNLTIDMIERIAEALYLDLYELLDMDNEILDLLKPLSPKRKKAAINLLKTFITAIDEE